MKKNRLYRPLILVLLYLSFQTTGCAGFGSYGTVTSSTDVLLKAGQAVYDATKSVFKSPQRALKRMRSDDGGLRKRVYLYPFLDQADLGEAKIEALTDRFVEDLERDGNLLVHRSETSLTAAGRMTSPKYGIVVDPDLAKRAEELGMNAVLTVVLSPFEAQTRKIGIWPFRRVLQEYEISVVVNALDITNGTLFLTNLESWRVKARGEEESEGEELIVLIKEEEKEEVIDETALDKALVEMMETQASTVREALEYQPWSGRILSAKGQDIIISAGQDVGLTSDSVFEVFDRGEPIRSASGRSLYLLGPKLGEIKTVEVKESYASAVPLEGDLFRAGQVIKAKN